MTITHEIWLLTACALTTAFTRFLPFMVFGKKRKVPEVITYLGKVLPCAIMATLVVYCLKGISLFTGNYGLPELISVAVVIALHIWKKNTLLSIGAGTICYMLLIRL